MMKLYPLNTGVGNEDIDGGLPIEVFPKLPPGHEWQTDYYRGEDPFRWYFIAGNSKLHQGWLTRHKDPSKGYWTVGWDEDGRRADLLVSSIEELEEYYLGIAAAHKLGI